VNRSQNQQKLFWIDSETAITQGDVEETINLTGVFEANIDMSRFATGQISMCFIYEDTGEVKVDVHLEKKEEGRTVYATVNNGLLHIL